MRRRMRAGRGRPKGTHNSRFDAKILEYVVELSLIHEIYQTEFFNAIVDAWKNGKATCKGLTIELRMKENSRAVFLITKGREVLAQFPIPEHILRETNPLKGFEYVSKRARFQKKIEKDKSNEHLLIKDLKVGMKGINLEAQVVEISKPKLVLTRLNDYVFFASATLSDGTGTIKLPLWNEQIKKVSVNAKVQIENANVTMFRGTKQLRIRRNGTLKVVENSSLHENERAVEHFAKQNSL